MREIYQRDGYVMDPHGATAYRALRRDLKPGEKGIFLATAHPSKFPHAVGQATGVRQKENQVTRSRVTEQHPTPRLTPSLPALKKILLTAT